MSSTARLLSIECTLPPRRISFDPNVSDPRREAIRIEGDDLTPERIRALLTDAATRGLPLRQAPGRADRACVGTVPSTKAGRAFEVASAGEAATVALADVAEGILAMSMQSVLVRFVADGTIHTAFPDLTVLPLGGMPEIWEVKSRGRVGPDRLKRLTALAAALRSIGVPYRVRQPHWFARQPRLGNAHLLRRCADIHLDTFVRVELGAAFKAGRLRTLGDAMTAAALSFPDALACVANGWMAADIGCARLSPNTPVRRARPGARSGAFDATLGLEL